MTKLSGMLGGSILLIALFGCGSKIDKAALAEGEAAGKDASVLYEMSQKEISLANKYSWQKWVELRGAKERDAQLAVTAKQLEAARDKFTAASTKITESLRGQNPFTNDETKSASRMGDAYRKWSEMAEYERKTLQESVGINDVKVLTDKFTEAGAKQAKMNENVMAIIKSAR
ncbi:MAG: hypothetical protein ABI791_02015 [Acidobacteriota bacterium]